MRSRFAIVFIVLTVVIDSMGIGLIMPVMPDLIAEVQTADIGDAARWGGILATVFAVMQFLFGPLLGNLSDRYGRRPILLFSLVFLTIDYLIMAVAGTIWWLLIGRVLGGITSGTQAAASAAMADISKPEDKAANFGLIGAGFGIGFVLGPLLGGALGEFGTRAPFYAAAALAAANALLGWLVLPETVTDEIRRPFEWRRANPLGAFQHLGRLPGLGRMFVIFFILALAFFVYPAIWAFFTLERFGWGPGMIGLSLALFGIFIAISQGLLIRPILARLDERRAIYIGLAIDVTAFTLFGFIDSGAVALAMTPIIALGSISTPALQGMMSRRTPDNQQGELQGAYVSINAVATIVAPLTMTMTFWYFTTGPGPAYLPGAPFLLSALITLAAFLLLARTPRQAPAG